jgi:hypothetical protein
MNKLTMSIIMLIMLFSCKKTVFLKSDLIGKWEAAYVVKADSDTIYYKEGTSFTCACQVVPLDYNSGFEFRDNKNGRLIWCGSVKNQHFNLSISRNSLTFKFDNTDYKVTIKNLTKNSFQLERDFGTYHMIKQ